MKLKRYHMNVYVPTWWEDSLRIFSFFLEGKPLIYSVHAKEKLRKMKKEHRYIVKGLVESVSLSVVNYYMDYVFEFYANNSNVMKKVCYRFPVADVDFDIILVVSDKGRIVTIYLNDNSFKHENLNLSLYEKGTILNEGESVNIS